MCVWAAVRVVGFGMYVRVNRLGDVVRLLIDSGILGGDGWTRTTMDGVGACESGGSERRAGHG